MVFKIVLLLFVAELTRVLALGQRRAVAAPARGSLGCAS
jgi:hypothetical protein